MGDEAHQDSPFEFIVVGVCLMTGAAHPAFFFLLSALLGVDLLQEVKRWSGDACLGGFAVDFLRIFVNVWCGITVDHLRLIDLLLELPLL